MTLREDIERLGLHRGSFPSPDANPWTWVFNFRDVFLDRDVLAQLARMFWESVPPTAEFQLGAVETAAIPLLTAISLFAPRKLNVFTVKKAAKPYGLQEDIEGTITDDPIILLDDMFNTGQSIGKARETLTRHDKTVAGIYVVLNVQSAKGRAWLAENQLPIKSLFTLADFNLTNGDER
jgi:orotate phosphoribosyltransferase